jgi:hypothetical protein
LNAVDRFMRAVLEDRGERLVRAERGASGFGPTTSKEEIVSHFIDTPQAPHGGFRSLPVHRRWEIIIGVVAVIAMGTAALMLVNSTESSPLSRAAPQTQVAPVAPDADGVGSLGAVDPCEAQFVSPQLRSVVLAEWASGEAGVGSLGAVDPFEAQFVSPQLRSVVLAEWASG